MTDYKLKQIPGDFIVKERTSLSFQPEGKYCYFILTKKNRNTIDAITEIARKLGIPEKSIGFAGSKDKNAITEQYCSIRIEQEKKLCSLHFRDASVKVVGYGRNPISLGDLQENDFEIIIRNLEQNKIKKIRWLVNYFDEQRFSVRNIDVGRKLLHKQFKEAVTLIDKAECDNHLKQYLHDYVGALKKLPLRLARMYINAYQSYLWNEMASAYLQLKMRELGLKTKEIAYSQGKLIFLEPTEELSVIKIPLIGFAEDNPDDKELLLIIQKIMDQEGIAHHDFIIKQIPELTIEGGWRAVFVDVGKLTIGKAENDELNEGKQKVRVTFFLPKGSYATMAIKQMMKC